jgi:peptide/nickel transport system permease protein
VSVATASTPVAPLAIPTAPGHSYWSIVRRQLRKNRVAMFGLWCVLGLLLVAIYAPVVASDRPFYYSGPEGTRWPWFSELFDRIQVKQPVDLFFNLLMLALPPFAVAWVLVRGRLRARGRWTARSMRRTAGLMGFLVVWTYLGVTASDALASNPVTKVLLAPGLSLRTAQADVDWHERIAEAEAAGHSVRAVFPPVPYHYDKTRNREAALAPDWGFGAKRTDLGAVGRHPLGTDPGGKDVLAALVYGTRISMTIGVIAVAIYVTIGVILGSLAGFFMGWVDVLISRFVEIMLCFPTLFFVLTIVSVFETRTIFLIMAVIGITAWPNTARLVRGEFLKERALDYVTAARAMAIPERRIIFRHVLPNALTPVLVTATFGIAGAILTESGIAFLGLGDPATASWGLMLAKGRSSTLDWLILAPGAAIFFTVTVFNLLGEGLRDALDPKLRQ